jgi:hypothetical protein
MEKNWWPYLLAGESVFFLFFWVVNPYLAWLLTLVLSPVFLSVFLIALMAEFFEKSKVGSGFFSFMLWMGILPCIWALIFAWIDDFQMSWLHS